MKLDTNWRAILKKAWSMKFIAASIVLSGLEVTFQLWTPGAIPPGIFAALAGLVSAAAALARLLAQPSLS